MNTDDQRLDGLHRESGTRGDIAAIDTVEGFEGVPSFTGDDLALVYAEPASNATGASLSAARSPPTT